MGYPRTKKANAGDIVQYLEQDYNDSTIRFVVCYPGRIASDILRSAVKKVVEAVDILHASFVVTDAESCWMIHDDYEEKDYFQVVDTNDDVLETAYAHAVESLQPTDKTMLRCYLVRGNKENAIVLLVSRFCADGVDGKYLLGKVAEIYNAILEKGTSEGITVKNGESDVSSIYDKMGIKDYRNLKKNSNSKIKSEFPYPAKEEGKPHIVKVDIPKETMKKVIGRLELKEITLNDLLLTSCYYAYASMPNKNPGEPMSILSMVDMRKCCAGGDSDGISNMTVALPTVLPIGLRESFSITLDKIVAQTKAVKDGSLAGMEGMSLWYVAARKLPMKVFMPLANKFYSGVSVGITNLGNISNAFLTLGGMEPDYGLFGGPMNKKPGLHVSVVCMDGNCTLCAVVEGTDEDAEIVRIMLERMAEEVQGYTMF